ncbi:MAG: glycosyltransferase family 2 protein [Micropepsaceae bacterium]
MNAFTVGASAPRANDSPAPLITIGVPVFNSERLLEGCLKNLAAQTCRDYRVIILDNASTDRTGVIAQAFAAHDKRFEYQRQPRNVGAKQNFADVLEMASTPYFMWRADDDLSDANFLEETLRLLEQFPKAALAVGRAAYEKNGRTRIRRFPRRMPSEPSAVYRLRMLMRSRASWIYALFRTAELKVSLKNVYASFPHVNGFDHLVLLPFLLTMRVVGSDNTTFTTRFFERAGAQVSKGFLDPAPMVQLRSDFIRYCRAQVGELLSTPAAAFTYPFLSLYAERTYQLPKILDAKTRVLFGQTPTGRAKSYD